MRRVILYIILGSMLMLGDRSRLVPRASAEAAQGCVSAVDMQNPACGYVGPPVGCVKFYSSPTPSNCEGGLNFFLCDAFNVDGTWNSYTASGQGESDCPPCDSDDWVPDANNPHSGNIPQAYNDLTSPCLG
jgi:hypothetical protein